MVRWIHIYSTVSSFVISTLTCCFVDSFSSVFIVLIMIMAMSVVHVFVIVHLPRISIRGRVFSISHVMLVMTMRSLAGPYTVDLSMRRNALVTTSERFIASPWFHVPFLFVHVTGDGVGIAHCFHFTLFVRLFMAKISSWN